ncbi:MAG TPA: hypothetical protein PK629_09365 [Oscillospiraceae bacterium]|nr:hypothetical protein [Oscillospiraceae bacterium]HPF54980.1 hypothetical protein [Clostridiales bacterium]HPK34393.1 hypothetical protein [Oscillospiraceae bacterium]HPR76733.1 hypothetical protein [Oscillospiraceae bacterium]
MKKLLSLILALALILMLPGCGLLGKAISKAESIASDFAESTYSEPDEYSEPEYSYDENYDYSGSDTIYGQMTAEEKASFIQQAALSGCTVTFNADGSTSFAYEDGSVTTQNADGTWVYSDEDGTNITQFGGEWPDNEFTRLVPKPDFGELLGAVTSEDSFYVSFTSTDLNQVRAYIEQVKETGFTVDATTTDESAFGIAVVSYTAYNAAGYKIEIASTMGVNGITISKE